MVHSDPDRVDEAERAGRSFDFVEDGPDLSGPEEPDGVPPAAPLDEAAGELAEASGSTRPAELFDLGRELLGGQAG